MGLSVGFVGKTEALIFRFSVRWLAVRVCGLLCGFRYISPNICIGDRFGGDAGKTASAVEAINRVAIKTPVEKNSSFIAPICFFTNLDW